MKAREAIAFMGALRGLPLADGPQRAPTSCSTRQRPRRLVDKPIRSLSKGMAQTVQLLGTIVHEPELIVLDEPFSGLDAINQGRLEQLIRDEAAGGATIIFSTHVIAHAERLCERIAIIAGGKVRFEGTVDDARDRLRPQVRLEHPQPPTAPWRAALPGGAAADGRRLALRAARERDRAAAPGADRRRRRDRGAVDRAAGPARRLRRHRRRGRRRARWTTATPMERRRE